MELFAHLAEGFSVALSPWNAFVCVIGIVVGTFVGALPGIGPLTTMAMLLPITFGMSPAASLIMLSGIYYGAQYGESTSAILINIPGGATSVITCAEGYRMARSGRAGAALYAAAIGSLFAGLVGTILLGEAAAPLAKLALEFSPADYCTLMGLGLVVSVALGRSSYLKSAAMVFLGLMLAMVGIDSSGTERYTFGMPELFDGVPLAPFLIGLFGISEMMWNAGRVADAAHATIGTLRPSREEHRRMWPAIVRGTGIGALLGALPGGGPVVAPMASYAVEERLRPERFGNGGAIEGVASPEAANNAAAQTSYIPLLALGIPGAPVTAILLGALMIQGITPGPKIFTEQPELVWGLICSMLVGNVLLVILNLPLIRLWVKLVTIPLWYLVPAVLCFAAVGVYSFDQATVDLMVLAFGGSVGFLCRRLGYDIVPLVMGFVLARPFEENLRTAVSISYGDYSVFATSPISGTLLAVAAVAVCAKLYLRARRQRLA